MLINVCKGDYAAERARQQRAAEAGALEAVVEAIRVHPQVAAVQRNGCTALLSMCSGVPMPRARWQRAAQAGARGVVVAAMQAHPGDRVLQLEGELVLNGLLA
jgi:hypothetical protein